MHPKSQGIGNPHAIDAPEHRALKIGKGLSRTNGKPLRVKLWHRAQQGRRCPRRGAMARRTRGARVHVRPTGSHGTHARHRVRTRLPTRPTENGVSSRYRYCEGLTRPVSGEGPVEATRVQEQSLLPEYGAHHGSWPLRIASAHSPSPTRPCADACKARASCDAHSLTRTPHSTLIPRSSVDLCLLYFDLIRDLNMVVVDGRVEHALCG